MRTLKNRKTKYLANVTLQKAELGFQPRQWDSRTRAFKRYLHDVSEHVSEAPGASLTFGISRTGQKDWS